MNYFYGATGYLHWALNQWHCRMGQFSPGDEWIIWPGRFRPNSSLRYEAQREGLEDCELLHMLQQANAEAAERMGFEDFDAAQRPNEITATVMRAFTDYTRSYDELSRARDYLLREIAEAKRGPLFLTTAEPAAVDPVAPGTVKLSGRAAAGVEITVNGKPMAVTDGRFSATVSVNQDSPEIVVTGKLKDRSFETRRRYRLRD